MYLTKQTQPADKHTNKQNKNNKISSTNTQPRCTNVTSRKTKQMHKHKKRSNHTKITKIANTTSRQTNWRKKERINKREGKQASCIQALLLKSRTVVVPILVDDDVVVIVVVVMDFLKHRLAKIFFFAKRPFVGH
jgi:hypothetical protein